MTIAEGTIQYQLGTSPVKGCGLSYSTDELDATLSGSVAGVLNVDFKNIAIEEFLDLIA